jgi:hypothetical protein
LKVMRKPSYGYQPLFAIIKKSRREGHHRDAGALIFSRRFDAESVSDTYAAQSPAVHPESCSEIEDSWEIFGVTNSEGRDDVLGESENS